MRSRRVLFRNISINRQRFWELIQRNPDFELGIIKVQALRLQGELNGEVQLGLARQSSRFGVNDTAEKTFIRKIGGEIFPITFLFTDLSS